MALQYHLIPVTPFAQNCSILWCDVSNEAAIVDAGGEHERLEAWVKQQGLEVKKLLLTHGHIDHAGAAAALAQRLNVCIEGPEASERFWLDALPQQSQMFGFPLCAPLTPTRWLKEGDTVSVGNETLTVLHCPGHTPGHIVFYSEAARLLIAGDVLFHRSIGRTDFPRGDHQQLIDSIRNKLFVLPDETTVLPGHGPTTSIGDERRFNPFVTPA